MAITEDPGQSKLPAGALKCPKCSAPRRSEDTRCGACGIVFAKWLARQDGIDPRAPRDRRRNGESSGGAKRFVLIAAAVVVVLAGATGAWWMSPPINDLGNNVLVTFEDGKKCRLSEWGFRYRRAFSNNRSRGGALMVGRTQFEIRDDQTLRIVGPDGDKLALEVGAIREIRFEPVAHEYNTSRRAVNAMTLVTPSDWLYFTPQEIPRFSRSRLLVPDASHYYDNKHNDKYKHWAAVTVSLKGIPTPECGDRTEFNLTAHDHPKSWTPMKIQFPGA